MSSDRRRRTMAAAVKVGPLAPYEVLLRTELTRVGYAPFTVNETVLAMARMSAWMQACDIAVASLTPRVVERFLAVRRARCSVEQAACYGVRTVLRVLRAAEVVPRCDPTDESPAESVLADFRSYLVGERGLAPATVRSYSRQAGKLLSHLTEPLIEALAQMDSATVTMFVVAQTTGSASVGSAKCLITALRAFLRYLHVQGIVPASLVGAVPAVAGWRLAGLPRGLTSAQVEALLAVSDGPDRPAWMRDHAVVTVLARLGLRSAEVAALMLDDIDWAGGELLVRGKGSRVERLPVTPEVGEAMAAYVTRRRPRCSSRALFVTARPPYQPISTSVIREIMARACRRAGLPRLGAHRLRHTLATQMLRAGSPLAEIGQVLRQRSQLATAIYAKVDHEALRALARPWPAGAR